MANFKSGYILTTAGKALQAKVEAGETTLKLTKMSLGDGSVASIDDYADKTDLVSRKYDMIVSKIEAKTVGCTVLASVNSQAVDAGFDVTELGLFAQDGETEILYCVSYDEDAMYVPGKSDGSAVECEFAVYIQFATAEKIEIVLPTDVSEIVKWVENNTVKCEEAAEKSEQAIQAADRAEQEAANATTAAATAESMKEDAVKASEAAATSEINAKTSETAAKESETNAATSASNAKASETAAKASQEAAKASETNAAASEKAAATSETNAAASEAKAKASETAAASSEAKALASEQAAKASEANAAASEAAAKTSETNAAASEKAAAESASAAAASETAAKASADAAATSETNAKASETAAATSETNAAASETAAAASAKKAEEEAQKVAKALKYKGSVETYADLPTDPEVGDMWNVKTADKSQGIKAGDNVAWSGTEWDNMGGKIDLSDYALVADQLKDVTSATSSGATITLIQRDGTKLPFTIDNVANATKAAQDGNGNNIASTYATKTSVASVAKYSSASTGSGVNPVYLSSGTVTVSTSSVGASNKPIYMSSGTLTASSSTIGGTAKPLYMSSGTLTALSATVGSSTKPVYLSSGTITASNSTVGGTSTPIYLNNGTFTACTMTSYATQSWVTEQINNITQSDSIYY